MKTITGKILLFVLLTLCFCNFSNAQSGNDNESKIPVTLRTRVVGPCALKYFFKSERTRYHRIISQRRIIPKGTKCTFRVIAVNDIDSTIIPHFPVEFRSRTGAFGNSLAKIETNDSGIGEVSITWSSDVCYYRFVNWYDTSSVYHEPNAAYILSTVAHVQGGTICDGGP